LACQQRSNHDHPDVTMYNQGLEYPNICKNST